MNAGRSRQAWKLGALLVLAVVQGSSAASALQSLAASPSVPVAPLPAETAQIAARSAPHVMAAVRAWWGACRSGQTARCGGQCLDRAAERVSAPKRTRGAGCSAMP